ncbi:MAG TPA: PP2C family serine/threonine-protein phosphatase [Acidimicrobiales bacterium]|nr:PP2C family serine/threonine-protein phosphatase [Acidimicrobiales bacterium]
MSDPGAESITCVNCGESGHADDRFCEECGAPLTSTGEPGPVTPGPILGATPGMAPSPYASAASWQVPSPAPPPPPPDMPAPARPRARPVPTPELTPLTPLRAAGLCLRCGAPTVEVRPDGSCPRCGGAGLPSASDAAAAPAPAGPAAGVAVGDPDRDELVDGPIAAVTDRGRHHWRNEDAVSIRWVPGRPGGFVMVVCDGVSVSQEPQVVSRAASNAAMAVLAGAVHAGGDLDAAMKAATAAAQRAVAALPYDPSLDLGPGACTFVAAAVRGSRASFASVGDSRAYWVDASGVVQIGQDDSVAAELVATGRYTHHQAMASPGAHAITKWLGADSDDAQPRVTGVELPGPGLVVLATDGLWNYAPEPEDLGRVIGSVGAEPSLDLARRLAAFAMASGGSDNITVAVGPHALGGLEV